MIRDITIGQYYMADSPIHRLDPRVKVLGTLLYIISLFLFRRFAGFLVAGAFFGLVVLWSEVPFRFVMRGLKPIVFMLILTAALNLLWTPGDVLLQIGVVEITAQGVQRSAFLALRLIFLMVGSSMMTLTTSPNRLTSALEKLLRPLHLFHVPVHDVAMMMTIALRFIPILVEETGRIMKAQKARGADFESGNLLQRLKSLLPVLVPLFASAMRRATDLANAMDARCYHGGAGRTKMKPLRYQARDYIGYLVIVAYLVLVLCAGRFAPF